MLNEEADEVKITIDNAASFLVSALIGQLGLDKNQYRDVLHDTPRRIAKAWEELLGGYKEDPKQVLSYVEEHKGFQDMVVSVDNDFTSICKHHLLPFSGVVHIGYIPNDGKIVGYSKLPRLVQCFAKRLQLQEIMTQQIADAIDEVLKPKGVIVVAKASHACATIRGVKQSRSKMISSAVRGIFLHKPDTRAEFMGLIK